MTTPWPRYEPGDPDPTTEAAGDCPSRGESGAPVPYFCTWGRNHEHPQHIAGTLAGKIAHVWDVEEP